MGILKKIKKIIYRFPIISKKYCCICNRKIGDFLPYRNGMKSVPKLMRALDCVGSDVENFSCPKCNSHDRERHLYLYSNALGIIKKFQNSKILHFAPEKNYSKIIKSQRPEKYIMADLYPENKDTMKVNMLSTEFMDNFFDFIIANHVLEHVQDDLIALKELYRILKPGGLAILQTPFSKKIYKTFSDQGIADEEARLQAYGQEDHVRLYGMDFQSRVESVGFRGDIRSHESLLNDIDPKYYGVNDRELFLIFYK